MAKTEKKIKNIAVEETQVETTNEELGEMKEKLEEVMEPKAEDDTEISKVGLGDPNEEEVVEEIKESPVEKEEKVENVDTTVKAEPVEPKNGNPGNVDLRFQPKVLQKEDPKRVIIGRNGREKISFDEVNYNL